MPNQIVAVGGVNAVAEPVCGFNDVPNHKELRSFPYHIREKGEIGATEIKSIDEALSYIEKTL